MRNLVNFNDSSGKYGNLHFKDKELCCEKMTYGFKNDIGNLVNLLTSS